MIEGAIGMTADSIGLVSLSLVVWIDKVRVPPAQ
jgi:hypothetical protein